MLYPEHENLDACKVFMRKEPVAWCTRGCMRTSVGALQALVSAALPKRRPSLCPGASMCSTAAGDVGSRARGPQTLVLSTAQAML